MSVDLRWITEGLKKPGKTRSGLAKAMNRHPSVVTFLLNGKRDLKAKEVETIARYLGVAHPGHIPPKPEANELLKPCAHAARDTLADSKFSDCEARTIALAILEAGGR